MEQDVISWAFALPVERPTFRLGVASHVWNADVFLSKVAIRAFIGGLASVSGSVEFARPIAAYAVRRLRRWRNKLTIILLRFKGCQIAWSATIDPDAVFERSDGKILVGANTFIDKGVIVRSLGGSVNIGADCSVNAYTLLSGSGGLQIGNSVRIGSHVAMVASNHVFSDPDTLIRNQGLSLKGICIDDDVWIGAGAKVLDGVFIGRGCVLAAGTVVTRSTEPLSIIAGVPGRCIGRRGESGKSGYSSL